MMVLRKIQTDSEENCWQWTFYLTINHSSEHEYNAVDIQWVSPKSYSDKSEVLYYFQVKKL